MLIESAYRSPWYLPGADLQTVIPHLRSIRDVTYKRQRVELNDGDFVDVDWSAEGRDRLAIIVHGLEGHADRPYMRSTVRAFNRAGWDALAWNMRACSGEVNRTAGFYHAGLSADLVAVLEHAMQVRAYEYIALAGFSLGGTLILHLGEQGRACRFAWAAATFSVPVIWPTPRTPFTGAAMRLTTPLHTTSAQESAQKSSSSSGAYRRRGAG